MQFCHCGSEYGFFLTSRMTLLFFALSGLDVLGCSEVIMSFKHSATEWIYAQQILPDSDNPGDCGSVFYWSIN